MGLIEVRDGAIETEIAIVNRDEGGVGGEVDRRVSTTLRQSAKEFSEYSFLENPMRRVC